MVSYPLKDIVKVLEDFAPLHYQESYDNSGLQVGIPETEVSSVLVCVDVTEDILNQAIAEGYKLIISHHPLIFKGLKRISNRTEIERIVYKAIQHNIAIYASHTNLDSVPNGVSGRMCKLLGLKKCKVLLPKEAALVKLITFAPTAHAEKVRLSMLAAGAGSIGNYDSCSFNTSGIGTFRAGNNANPFVGKVGEVHREEEIKIETVVEKRLLARVLAALHASHPYEEVAYDIYPLENKLHTVGIGMVGELAQAMNTTDFLTLVKKTFNQPVIRHTKLIQEKVQRIAVCGGSGSSLTANAIAAKADVYVTADFTYHKFFEAEGKIILTDLGHYESEQLAIDIIKELLLEKFPTFAVQTSKSSSNPICYM